MGARPVETSKAHPETNSRAQPIEDHTRRSHQCINIAAIPVERLHDGMHSRLEAGTHPLGASRRCAEPVLDGRPLVRNAVRRDDGIYHQVLESTPHVAVRRAILA